MVSVSWQTPTCGFPQFGIADWMSESNTFFGPGLYQAAHRSASGRLKVGVVTLSAEYRGDKLFRSHLKPIYHVGTRFGAPFEFLF
jgi:hypothetical protein